MVEMNHVHTCREHACQQLNTPAPEGLSPGCAPWTPECMFITGGPGKKLCGGGREMEDMCPVMDCFLISLSVSPPPLSLTSASKGRRNRKRPTVRAEWWIYIYVYSVFNCLYYCICLPSVDHAKSACSRSEQFFRVTEDMHQEHESRLPED